MKGGGPPSRWWCAHPRRQPLVHGAFAGVALVPRPSRHGLCASALMVQPVLQALIGLRLVSFVASCRAASPIFLYLSYIQKNIVL